MSNADADHVIALVERLETLKSLPELIQAVGAPVRAG